MLIGSSWLVRLSGPLIYTTFGMTASLCQVHSLRRWGLGLVAAALAALGLRNQPAKAAIFLDSTCIRCTASAGNRPNSISFLERFQPQVIFDVFFFFWRSHGIACCREAASFPVQGVGKVATWWFWNKRQRNRFPDSGNEDIMKPKAHGSTEFPVQDRSRAEGTRPNSTTNQLRYCSISGQFFNI